MNKIKEAPQISIKLNTPSASNNLGEIFAFKIGTQPNSTKVKNNYSLYDLIN